MKRPTSESIKIYDKFARILRIETTTNDVSFFKHHRKVEHRSGHATREVAPLKKSIYSLIASVAPADDEPFENVTASSLEVGGCPGTEQSDRIVVTAEAALARPDRMLTSRPRRIEASWASTVTDRDSQ